MQWRIAFCLLITSLMVTPAAAEDPRAPTKLPPDVRAAFMEEMRQHMDSLDDVIAALAAADFAAAAKAARTELAIGGGKGFGRFMPVEFREMGMAMHRAAADFGDVAASVPAEPSGADWKRTVGALEDISAQCRACHSAFKVE
jgi:cytochrome c556